MNIPDDCTVRLIDHDVSVQGMISEDIDGHVNIYVNARLSSAGQRKALKHELDHYENDDLHNDRSIQEVEDDHRLPPLVRARDLKPPQPTKPRPLTSRQTRALRNCINELDTFLFDEHI